jgi:hypothetical protein
MMRRTINPPHSSAVRFSIFSVLAAIMAAVVLMQDVARATDSTEAAWGKSFQDAAFVKEGMDRFRHPRYQYECLGLGGTVMRVGPDGFNRPGGVLNQSQGHLKNLPYLSYQYWWDEEGHRHLPFELRGGYGNELKRGQVTAFRHRLDIATGFLKIDLGIKLDPSGDKTFQSRREMFVTPEGVLVIRISDTADAPEPFRLRVDINRDVRIYLNGGVYDKPHDPWTGEGEGKPQGLLVVAKRPKSCTAALGIALEGAETSVDAKALELGATKPGKSVTFYIVPGSSYENADAASSAWKKAEEAKSRGFETLRGESAKWWRNYYEQSHICLPDPALQKWFARSTYYMGVFFGNTDVPPGCNGTSVESFAGAICPEYDLVLDQMALLYGNHFDEARRVVGWLERVLPRAEKYATEGLTLHQTSVKYEGGAKFGPLMGYDGTVLVPPTAGEGVWAHEDFSGNNAALMALRYVDWSGDESCEPLARKILRETTRISVEDLEWRDDFQSYLNRFMSAAVQQAGTLFGLRESVRRGVAETGWADKAEKILIPKADYMGKKLLAVGPGQNLEKNCGDATWLSPAWYYRVVADDDPIVSDSYALFRTSKTGDYIFNNGWMGVIAAKLGLGDEALQWARNFLRPDVTLFDDTCFGEIISDFEDFKKTPEVAAHAALICNLTQMLLDPDNEESILVFPAIPAEWEQRGVSFDKLAAKGNILVSAEFKTNRVDVKLENRSDKDCFRSLHVRMPKGATSLRHPEKDVQVKDGWAVLPSVKLPAKSTTVFAFEPLVGAQNHPETSAQPSAPAQ